MTALDRIRLALRILLDRGLQTRSSYKGDVRMIQTQQRQGADPIDAEHIEPFGFSGHAPDGSETIALNFSGSRSLAVVLFAHNRDYKMKLEQGEVSIYNQWGDYVKLRKDRTIEVKADTKVLADCPLFECTNDALIGGNLVVQGTSMLMSNTTVAAGAFTCVAPAAFAAAMTNAGTDVGKTHDHYAGNESDGSTGTVR